MKVIAFGEVNMRLTPPEYKLLEQSTQLDYSFSGTGLNILSGLHQFDISTALFTVLPDNRVGKTASSFIRKLGVDDSAILYTGNHIGVYFAELGYGSRPTNVTYLNRTASSFCSTVLNQSLIEEVIQDADIVHICGIALSISAVSRKNALLVARTAKQMGKKICFDFNYRPSLNIETEKEDLLQAYEEILSYSLIVFGGERDLTDLLGMKREEVASQRAFFELFLEQYNVEVFSGTIKDKIDGRKTLKGFLSTQNNYAESSEKTIKSYDRIGSGDAFASGILCGLMNQWDLKFTVEFASVNCQLSFTTYGDSPVLSKDFVLDRMKHPDTDIIR